mgnify:CR=1 FL=1
MNQTLFLEFSTVLIDGTVNLAGTTSVHASQLYAKNVSALISYMCPEGELQLNMEDEIISGSMFTHNGEITNKITLEMLNGDN